MVLSLLTAIYVVCALLLTLYAVGAIILLLTYLRFRNKTVAVHTVTDWPVVAVQLPIYNEVFVVERLLDSVAALDYPRDRLIVQVLDDSNDETSDVIARKVAELQAGGLEIHHVQRPVRKGYKAGALSYGLTLLKQAEFVAVLDADFVPPPEFLRRTVAPLVEDSNLGMVQTRWGHLNSTDNVLTMGQMLALDGHFVVEQTARNRAGWLMNFNGTCGVWRIRTIEEAGGWQDSTLAEDLDLSYRAQLQGWRFLYLSDVIVPGELPPHIAAYKQQQARWAKGGTQCMTQLMRPVWTNPQLTLMQRFMGTMHLCQYMVHPVIITMLLLTPVLLVTHTLETLPLGTLGMAGFGPPLIFVVSQQALHKKTWRRNLRALPTLLILGTGMAWNNTRAVMSGLMGRQEEFKRTPKFASNARGSKYSLKLNFNIFLEFGLAAYAMGSFILASRISPSLAPYLLIYAIAFAMVGFWGLRDYLAMRKASA